MKLYNILKHLEMIENTNPDFIIIYQTNKKKSIDNFVCLLTFVIYFLIEISIT